MRPYGYRLAARARHLADEVDETGDPSLAHFLRDIAEELQQATTTVHDERVSDRRARAEKRRDVRRLRDVLGKVLALGPCGLPELRGDIEKVLAETDEKYPTSEEEP